MNRDQLHSFLMVLSLLPALGLLAGRPAQAAANAGQKTGKRSLPIEPRNLSPDQGSDKPVLIHRLPSIFQLDQQYADLKDERGHSEICGLVTLGQAMLYLKNWHQPPFPNLLRADGLKGGADDDALVHRLVKVCRAGPGGFLPDKHLQRCAARIITDSGYQPLEVRDQGNEADGHPVTPDDLHRLLENKWSKHKALGKSDRAIILLFGWFAKKDGEQKYRRLGGHYTLLVGHDDNDRNTFYIANPLVAYDEGHWYSKLVLEPAPANQGLPLEGMYQTSHLAGGTALMMLENAISILPGAKRAVTKPAAKR